MCRRYLCIISLLMIQWRVRAFVPLQQRRTCLVDPPNIVSRVLMRSSQDDDQEEAKVIEEVRLNILESRRNQIRFFLRSAEQVRNFRISQGFVPELDPDTGKPVSSDGKVAVTFTAFVVAAGAILLRVGGRAALVSTLGLDFVSDNPELKENLDQILDASENMDLATKMLLFTAGWTAVKVLCFDVAGVALALASGILFGGVIQGAIASSTSATIGSSVAFALAKLETPVRKRALDALEEYPALRGIEKVVAQDGLKAILTLRLAPILPIPIGLYNYIYAVTGVPFFDFAGGIFLGSFKPYLLDSYLGYFGKEIVQGASDTTGMQDILLLVALGASVLIGVFASQLAAETWDSVLEEVEAEKKALKEKERTEGTEKDDAVMRSFLGFEFPEWAIRLQYALQEAEERMNDLVDIEYEAKVWNYTKTNSIDGPPPDHDPAQQPGSPELEGINQGIQYIEGLYESLVLSPIMFSVFFKYADPLYDEAKDEALRERALRRASLPDTQTETKRKELLSRLEDLREQTIERIDLVEDRLEQQRRESGKS